MTVVQALMDRAASDGVFPGGVLLAGRAGRIEIAAACGRHTYDPDSPVVSIDTVYDLASLTKVLATTLLSMIFADRGLLSLDHKLGRLLPEVPEDKAALTVAMLLDHSAGFCAWKPYYQDLEKLRSADRRAAIEQKILAEPLEYEPGTKAVYSDLGFILLGFMLEDLGGEPLPSLFRNHIAGPLGLAGTGYYPLDDPPAEAVPTEGRAAQRRAHLRAVSTTTTPLPWAGPPGMPGSSARPVTSGKIVADLRAAFLGESDHLVSPSTVRRFWTRSDVPGSTRALGFDTPGKESPSAGPFFSQTSVGHLGYTGTSLWHDPERDLTVVLLTNRVHPTADNIRIRTFRPDIHTAVVRELTDRTKEDQFIS